jgi:hypothetical protein
MKIKIYSWAKIPAKVADFESEIKKFMHNKVFQEYYIFQKVDNIAKNSYHNTYSSMYVGYGF